MEPRPRLCLVGPMIGQNPGHVTTQGEILGDRLVAAGYPVLSVSASPNRYIRLADIATTIAHRHRQIDIMLLQIYGGPSFVTEDLASGLGRAFRHRTVFHLHGGALPEFMARFPRWTERVFRRADVLVAPSQFLAEAVSRHGFSARVVPNLLELERYPFRLRRSVRPRLFWMRSFHELYDPMLAVEVLARLRCKRPDATLVMGGQDKGLQHAVRAAAAARGLDGAARFSGFLDHAGKVREAEAADIFINTNRVDNMPVALLEAGAMGLPVVATAVGGVPSLITHGVTGLLVPAGDADAMADAILSLIETPSLAERLSQNGRALAERSAWERVRLEWDDLLRDLMGEPNLVGARMRYS